MLLVFLGLLNIAMLISAVIIGINCSKVKQGSLHVDHPAAVKLLGELSNLRGNHSQVMIFAEEARTDLQSTIDNHAKLKEQIKEQKTLTSGYQTELKGLQAERENLQNNITSMEGSCGNCPVGWLSFNSSCYFFSVSSTTLKKNWHNSRSDCISRGSDLIVIDSPEKQTYVSNNIKALVTGRSTWENGVWVGLTDIANEKTWLWINNVTETESRYWAEGEPNNHGPEGEDCVVVVHSATNPWKTRYDAKCKTHKLSWLCEMPSLQT